MKAKAIRDLTQLREPDFYANVAEGLGLIVANVDRLREAAIVLANSEHYHGSRILNTIAEEEAAKFLILVDAVRCPKQPGERLSNQLGRFNDHLPKGLYAKACNYRPGTLGELQHYLNIDRDEFHLDGPNDCDWIFRNEIIQSREGQFYVDYVGRDDGHSWSDPALLSTYLGPSPEPASVSMSRTLFKVGLSTAEAIATVADVWRSFPLDFETPWSRIRDMNYRTLQLLEERGQLVEEPSDVVDVLR
ncbi:MAG: AbiV family abortive infection protein [Acidobacteria bacterium]|nr:AbiV family abortive infection protein [Acidobacteriota bacterium]